jgi:hypothetical protein
MEELILKYAVQAGAVGVCIYLIYSDRLDRKELYVPLKESIDKLSDRVITLLTKMEK